MTTTTLFDLLERLSSLQRMWNRQHPLLAELQPIQVSALIYLSHCNRYSNTPQAVTDYLGLTKGTVSQSLKQLEGKGLVEKQADPRDRRSVHLRLTDTARALLEQVAPPQFLQQAEQALGDEAPRLEVLLSMLLGHIQRHEQVPSFGLCRTCRFHQHQGAHSTCGLTGEPLAVSEGALICREHQLPGEVVA